MSLEILQKISLVVVLLATIFTIVCIIFVESRTGLDNLFSNVPSYFPYFLVTVSVITAVLVNFVVPFEFKQGFRACYLSTLSIAAIFKFLHKESNTFSQVAAVALLTIANVLVSTANFS